MGDHSGSCFLSLGESPSHSTSYSSVIYNVSRTSTAACTVIRRVCLFVYMLMDDRSDLFVFNYTVLSAQGIDLTCRGSYKQSKILIPSPNHSHTLLLCSLCSDEVDTECHQGSRVYSEVRPLLSIHRF